MVYDSYTGNSGRYTRLPIEIFTTDELCTEIIRRIEEKKEDFKVTAKMNLLYNVLSTEMILAFYKDVGKASMPNG